MDKKISIKYIIYAVIIVLLIAWGRMLWGIYHSGGADGIRESLNNVGEQQQQTIDSIRAIESGLDDSIRGIGQLEDAIGRAEERACDIENRNNRIKEKISDAQGRVEESRRVIAESQRGIEEGKRLLQSIRSRQKEN